MSVGTMIGILILCASCVALGWTLHEAWNEYRDEYSGE